MFEGLALQDSSGLFSMSLVVVDNDQSESARETVNEFATLSSFPVEYHVEPRQNIALARNKAVAHSCGGFVAFLDDDEFPTRGWLLSLLRACIEYGVDGALGPVLPHFDHPPPSWVLKGKFCERPTYPTGFIIDWKKGRTGNVLLKRGLFADNAEPFRREFLTGEDQDFFRRKIEQGFKFVWCSDAIAYEVTPPIRWNCKFMLKRALLRGANSRNHPNFGPREVLKSIFAITAYLAVLPVFLIFSYSKFMTYLIKTFDHLGKLLMVVGVNLIKEPYVTS
jgi:succinoglycan biosynthesis protein ExoM